MFQLHVSDSQMAKQAAPKTGKARIRFIMLEAEIPEGDLTQVTQAIQNALRPATVLQQRILPAAGIDHAGSDGSAELEIEDTIDESAAESEFAVATKGPSKPRTYPTPKVVEDVDLNAETSLVSFAAGRQPKSDLDRHLLVAAWFKECRDMDAVSADHIYTGYRKLGWSTSIGDFGKPLRSLKQAQLMKSAGRGLYSVNHLGLDKVSSMN